MAGVLLIPLVLIVGLPFLVLTLVFRRVFALVLISVFHRRVSLHPLVGMTSFHNSLEIVLINFGRGAQSRVDETDDVLWQDPRDITAKSGTSPLRGEVQVAEASDKLYDVAIIL